MGQLSEKLKQQQAQKKYEECEQLLEKALVKGSKILYSGSLADVVRHLQSTIDDLEKVLNDVKPKVSYHPLGLTPNQRIRYAKDNKGKKAVLFTEKKPDGVINFGISRCNRAAGDKFDRSEGIEQARVRAQAAENLHYYGKGLVRGVPNKKFPTVYVGTGGMYGQVREEDVLDLLDYYYSLTSR